jgi:hypothetical protein
MKNFGIMILCISLAVSAFIFALNGRYQVSTYQGDGTFGGMIWMKCDTITGRVWDLRTISNTGCENNPTPVPGFKATPVPENNPTPVPLRP